MSSRPPKRKRSILINDLHDLKVDKEEASEVLREFNGDLVQAKNEIKRRRSNKNNPLAPKVVTSNPDAYSGPLLQPDQGNAKDHGWDEKYGESLIGKKVWYAGNGDFYLDLYDDDGGDDGFDMISTGGDPDTLHVYPCSKLEEFSGRITHVERRYFNNQGWPTDASDAEDVFGGCSGEGGLIFLNDGSFLFSRHKDKNKPGKVWSTSGYGCECGWVSDAEKYANPSPSTSGYVDTSMMKKKLLSMIAKANESMKKK